MITQILKTTITFFNAANSALSIARENEEDLERQNFELVTENKALIKAC